MWCRAAVLEPFLQQACSVTASRIADSLSKQLESQPEAALGPEATAIVEEALLIGAPSSSSISGSCLQRINEILLSILQPDLADWTETL